MHILILYQYFGTPKGSWSTRFYEFSKRWIQEGYTVTIITSPYEKSDIKSVKLVEKKTIEGIDLIIINAGDSNRMTVFHRIIKAIQYAILASWYAVRVPAQVVIASSGPITVGIPALAARIFRNRKIVFEVRDLWPQGAVELKKITHPVLIKIGYWFEAICYKKSSLIVPCSIGMDQAIIKRFPNLNTLVVPHSSATYLFRLKEHVYPEQYVEGLKGKKIFIYAGSLGLMDDCIMILEAFKLLNNPELALVFVGDGVERTALEKFMDDNQMNQVYFIGLVPKLEVVKWFSIAYMSLITFKNYPVLHTSAPNKLYDSLAAGLPVMHNTTGWMKDLVDYENCGISVEPDNPEKFALAINAIVNNPAKCAIMVQNANRLADTIFNIDRNAKVYLEGLKSLVSVANA